MTSSRKKPKADAAVAKLTEDPIDERTPVQKYLAEKTKAEKLSPTKRKAIAKKAAQARRKDRK